MPTAGVVYGTDILGHMTLHALIRVIWADGMELAEAAKVIGEWACKIVSVTSD